MKKGRLVLAVLLMAALLTPLMAAGGLAEGNDKYYNEPGVLPIVKEPIQLTVAVQQSQHINDWNTNYMSKLMEERTGIDFVFDVYPDALADFNMKIELLIAAGGNDLPNVIIRDESQAVLMPWAEAGMIIPLTEYYDTLFHWGQESIDMSASLTKESVMKYITSYDGNIYGVFGFNDTQNNQYSGARININRKWLAQLGLPIPSTTEDFKETLIAFRDNDMNGNGDATDEIPLTGYKDSVGNLRKFLMTPFVYTQDNYWTNTDGVIGVSFNTDEWREGLRYAADLYKEGLIDQQHFTQDQSSLTVVNSQEPVVVGAYTRISTSNMAADDLKRYDYDRIEQLTNSATGETRTSVQPALPGIRALITKTCEYPEAAYMWLDYMTGVDMSILTRYGVEGQEWDWIDVEDTQNKLVEFWQSYEGGNMLEKLYGPGAKPPVGTRFFSATSWGTMQDTWWGQVGPNVMTEELQQTFGQMVPVTDREIASYVNEFSARYQLEEAMTHRDESLIVAGLVYNQAEQDVITNYYEEIRSYVDEIWSAYVVGTMDIEDDAAWNNYLRTLDNMGLNQCIEAAQSCFTRMNSN